MVWAAGCAEGVWVLKTTRSPSGTSPREADGGEGWGGEGAPFHGTTKIHHVANALMLHKKKRVVKPTEEPLSKRWGHLWTSYSSAETPSRGESLFTRILQSSGRWQTRFWKHVGQRGGGGGSLPLYCSELPVRIFTVPLMDSPGP